MILLLGGTGFLGQNIKSHFKKKNIKFSLIGRSSENDIVTDLLDKNAVKDVINKTQPDWIINALGFTNVDYCERCPQKAVEAHIKIPSIINLSRSLRKFRVIHISTDHVYNKIKSKENEVHALNIYSQTKYFGEFMFDQENDIILRTNFYGLDLKKNFSGFVEQILLRYKKREIVKGFDDVFFNPLYVKDLVRIILLLTQSSNAGIYNVGTTDFISKGNFIKKIFKHFSLDASKFILTNSNSTKLFAKRPKKMVSNVQKFTKDFKYSLPKIEDNLLSFVKEEYDEILRRINDEV